MDKNSTEQDETTAVDDVRRVRQGIANRHQGDMRQHMEETNRVFREMQAKLNLKVVMPPARSDAGTE